VKIIQIYMYRNYDSVCKKITEITMRFNDNIYKNEHNIFLPMISSIIGHTLYMMENIFRLEIWKWK
jgi:hypothetical protein